MTTCLSSTFCEAMPSGFVEGIKFSMNLQTAQSQRGVEWIRAASETLELFVHALRKSEWMRDWFTLFQLCGRNARTSGCTLCMMIWFSVCDVGKCSADQESRPPFCFTKMSQEPRLWCFRQSSLRRSPPSCCRCWRCC